MLIALLALLISSAAITAIWNLLDRRIRDAQSNIPLVVRTATPKTEWQAIQTQLAKTLVQGEGLCEWEILGQGRNEIFVWAVCAKVQPNGIETVVSVPAVVKIKQNMIAQAVVPGDGSLYAEDVQRLFPVSIQHKLDGFKFDAERALAHIHLRQKSPGPPLFALE